MLAAVLLTLWSGSMARAAHLDLACEGDDFVLTTGSEQGVCLVDPGKTGVCIDGEASAVWARCDSGCVATHGTAACSLPGEEAVGGSSVLSCPDGRRYLLRTTSGRGDCAVTTDGDGKGAHCVDKQKNSAQASCATGCLKSHGSGVCATYKAEAGR